MPEDSYNIPYSRYAAMRLSGLLDVMNDRPLDGYVLTYQGTPDSKGRQGRWVPQANNALLGFTPVNKAGDTMLGDLSLGTAKLTSHLATQHELWFSQNADSWQMYDNTAGYATLNVAPLIITYRGNRIWHEGNDGPGSTLDADTLDGINSTGFALVAHTHPDVIAAGASGFMSGTDKTKLDGLVTGSGGVQKTGDTMTGELLIDPAGNSTIGLTIRDAGRHIKLQYEDSSPTDNTTWFLEHDSSHNATLSHATTLAGSKTDLFHVTTAGDGYLNTTNKIITDAVYGTPGTPQIALGGAVSLTNVDQAATALTCDQGGWWLITATCDFTVSGAGDVNQPLIGSIASSVAPDLGSLTGQIVYQGPDASRATVANSWVAHFTSAPTLTLNVKKGAGSGASTAGANHTHLVVAWQAP